MRGKPLMMPVGSVGKVNRDRGSQKTCHLRKKNKQLVRTRGLGNKTEAIIMFQIKKKLW